MITSTDIRCVSKQFRERQTYANIIKKLQQKIIIGDKYGLVSPSEKIKAQRIIHHLKQSLIRLDNNKNNYVHPDVAPLLKLSRKDMYKAIFPKIPEGKEILPTKLETSIMRQLQNQSLAARAQMHKALLTFGVQYAAYKNHYMVFDSLTCRDDKLHQVFYEKKDNTFRRYIERFRNYANRIVYGSVRAARGKPSAHQYFAVIERGGNTGRLHIHVLHTLHDIDASDPNGGRHYPNHREINEFKEFWDAGNSTPIAVRYNGDAYTKRNWRWPVTRDATPIPMKAPAAVAGYMAKYIGKNMEDEKEDYPWRIRRSREFGKQIMRNSLQKTSDRDLILLMTSPLKIQIQDRSLPSPILYRETMKELLNRWNLDGSLGELVKNWQPQDTPLTLLKSSIQTTVNPNYQNIIGFVLKLLNEETVSNPKIERREARKRLEEKFEEYEISADRWSRPGYQTAIGVT